MSLSKKFNLARYLRETDKQFARIQATIDYCQEEIVDPLFEFCETDPEQRRFEGREQQSEEKQVA